MMWRFCPAVRRRLKNERYSEFQQISYSGGFLTMTVKKALVLCACLLSVWMFVLPAPAQEDRGKAELKAAAGNISVSYGRPQLKGRDPWTWQKEGAYWRMGSGDMTTLTTSVDLMVGSTRLTKGTYGLWLLKVSAEKYELVFNKETTGMGMNHDKAKDVASIPVKKEPAASPVETFTIELVNRPSGATFSLAWGTAKLSADLQFAK
jgi:hypothetical protein